MIDPTNPYDQATFGTSDSTDSTSDPVDALLVPPPRKKRRIGLTTWLVLLGIAVFLGYIGSTAIGVLPYSHGSRVGVVNKFSEEKGWLIKSTEGSLFMAGEAAGLGQGNTWEFSVNKADIKEQIRKAMEQQQRVRLEYQEYKMNWGLTETNYLVTSVTTLGPAHSQKAMTDQPSQ